MNSASHLENSIPLLTEVIALDDSPPATDTTSHHQPAQDGTAQPSDHADMLTAGQVISPEALEQLEKNIRENVLRQLLTRVDFVLEHRVRDGLADVLQTAVDGLAKDIRLGLSRSLEEVIHRTVSQEISKIQSGQSKNG